MSSLATGSGSGGSKEFQVGGKYRLVRRIGSGSFGDIYLGVNITNGEVCVCVVVCVIVMAVCECGRVLGHTPQENHLDLEVPRCIPV